MLENYFKKGKFKKSGWTVKIKTGFQQLFYFKIITLIIIIIIIQKLNKKVSSVENYFWNS